MVSIMGVSYYEICLFVLLPQWSDSQERQPYTTEIERFRNFKESRNKSTIQLEVLYQYNREYYKN